MNADTLVVVAFALLVLLAVVFVTLNGKDEQEEANERKLRDGYDRQMKRQREQLASMGDEESKLQELYEAEDKPKRKAGRPRKVA